MTHDDMKTGKRTWTKFTKMKTATTGALQRLFSKTKSTPKQDKPSADTEVATKYVPDSEKLSRMNQLMEHSLPTDANGNIITVSRRCTLDDQAVNLYSGSQLIDEHDNMSDIDELPTGLDGLGSYEGSYDEDFERLDTAVLDADPLADDDTIDSQDTTDGTTVEVLED